MKLDELKGLSEVGWDLAYWATGEYQAIKEKLHDLETVSKREDQGLDCFNPGRAQLFTALRRVPRSQVRVCVLGQDPYPRRMHCDGIAFSVPGSITQLPPTLVNIFKEYQDDLGYPAPKNGDLTKWCEQGVLLWNVYPVCLPGKPGSCHWIEWEPLTQEILEILDAEPNPPIVVSFGSVAGRFADLVSTATVLRTSHPSPLGAKYGFIGSKIFSKINDELVHLGRETINWRLP